MAALDWLSELVVATDDDEVMGAVEAFRGRAVKTRADHRSGTDRVAEVAERPEFRAYPWIINLQGDEPFLAPAAVRAALDLVREGWDVGTVATSIADLASWRDPSTVKVIRNDAGQALYFSRAPIPYDQSGEGSTDRGELALRHVGVYAFGRESLRRAIALPPHPLEVREELEQLRWLAAGLRVGCAVIADRGGPGIDTRADLERAEALLAGRKDST